MENQNKQNKLIKHEFAATKSKFIIILPQYADIKDIESLWSKNFSMLHFQQGKAILGNPYGANSYTYRNFK